MLYGSQQNCTEMLPCDRSHQLGEGHPNHTAVSILNHPSRLVYESQGSNAEMPMRYRSQGKGRHRIAEMPSTGTPFPPVYGSPCYHAAMPIYDRSQGKGQSFVAEMLLDVHPSPPVYGSHLVNTAMLMTDRSHQFMGGSEETHSNVTGIALSHQLGKDIICTLIKPLLFLPFLLIYGSRYRYAAMSFRGRSHQIWAKLNPQKCQSLSAQYNQRLSTTRSNATT